MECAPFGRLTGLPKDAVAKVSQIVTVDKDFLTERVGKLPCPKLDCVVSGIDVVLGRSSPRQLHGHTAVIEWFRRSSWQEAT